VFGDMAALSALSVHVYEETSSGLALSGLLLARVAPRLLGAFAGAVGDRMELRRLLIICDLLSGVLFAAIAVLQPSYVVLLVMVFAAELAATVELPASRTMIARVLPDEQRGRANGAVTAATAIGVALGAPFGGLVLGLWGYQYALLTNSATFFVSMSLLFLIRRVPPGNLQKSSSTVWVSATDGVRRLVGDRTLLLVTAAMVAVTFAFAMGRPALVPLTQRDLLAGPLGYGLLMGAVAGGNLAGAILAARWRPLTPSPKVFLIGIGLVIAGHAAITLSPWYLLVLAMAVIVGCGNALESVCGTTLAQRRIPVERVGVVMGTVTSATFLADALGSLAGGPLLDVAGARWTLAAATVVMTVATAVLIRLGLRPVTSPAKEEVS
jgi:MFS family permease